MCITLSEPGISSVWVLGRERSRDMGETRGGRAVGYGFGNPRGSVVARTGTILAVRGWREADRLQVELIGVAMDSMWKVKEQE